MSTQMRNHNVAITQPISQRSLQTRALPQSLALIGGDVFSGLVAHLVVGSLFRFFGGPKVSWKVTATWLVLWLLWRAYQGLYPGYGQSPQNELRRHTVSTAQVAVAQLAAAFAVQRFAPSGLLVILEWLVILVIGLPLRYGVRSLLIHFKMFGRPVSIIGAGETAQLAIRHLKNHPSYGLNPVVAYDDNNELHGGDIYGVPILGSLELALTDPQTEQALISMPGVRAEVVQRIVNSTYAVFPYTWLIPDLFGVPNQALQPHNIGSVVSLEMHNNLRSIQSRLTKKIIDVILSIMCFLLFFPILIIIAILIRLDSEGPIIYKADRIGRNGIKFPCYKFRSMYYDADIRLVELLNSDDELKIEYNTFHKLKNDPRVTRVGTFLRKTSLDELPQLINVFLGQMSLVGPRPYMPREQFKMGDAAFEILLVNPGITGYWQVNERGESTFERRLDMDKFYITNWSPWLDAIILIQTLEVVFAGKGAY